jgi:hypothetical protein
VIVPRIWTCPVSPGAAGPPSSVTMRSSWVGSGRPCEDIRTSGGSVWSVIVVCP